MRPTLDDIRTRLWQDTAAETYGDQYARHVLEQYKICLEMADRISQRRGTANTYFLTLNTGIVAALATFYDPTKDIPPVIGIAFFVATSLFCVAWGVMLRSYRNLNTAKFMVIGLLEERLPASPFYAAEWTALAEGKDWRVYIPLGPIEIWLPVIFFFLNVGLALTLFGGIDCPWLKTPG